MELVKQRKRRLLAWLITIALCISIWQGNAYATGTVKLYLQDEDGNGINISLVKVSIGGWTIEESGDAGYITISNGSSGVTSLDKSDVKVIGGTTEISHNVIGFKPLDGEGLTESLELTEVTSSVSAVLGKSICVNYSGWNGASGIIVTDSQESSGGKWKTEQGPNGNDGEGQSFKWIDEESNEYYLPGTEYPYPAFEKVLNLSPAVSGSGTYSLKAGYRYRLGSGTWSVGDGYLYSGDQTFYVASDGTYSITQ